jgi:TonB family protein
MPSSKLDRQRFLLLFVLSLFLPLALSQEAPGNVPMPNDPKALMLLASKSNNLATNDIKPWHIKATFQLFDEQGNPTDEGTYEEFWDGPSRFKRIFTGKTLTQTDYGSEKGVLRSGSHDDVSPLLLDMRRDLVAPLPTEQTIEREGFDLKSINASEIKLSCLSVTAPPRPLGLTYCLSSDEPILRVSAYSGQNLQIFHNRILHFEDRTVAGDLKIARGTKALLIARVETIETLAPLREIDFAPSADATLLARHINISADVAAGLLEQPHPAPLYPPEAKAARISGTVVMQAVIGVDGQISDLQIAQGPRELQQAAIDAVHAWRYRPYLLNGSPVEVHTTINVVFKLGK